MLDALHASREAADGFDRPPATPYPPQIPAAIPGERLNDAVVDYLRSGLAAG